MKSRGRSQGGKKNGSKPSWTNCTAAVPGCLIEERDWMAIGLWCWRCILIFGAQEFGNVALTALHRHKKIHFYFFYPSHLRLLNSSSPAAPRRLPPAFIRCPFYSLIFSSHAFKLPSPRPSAFIVSFSGARNKNCIFFCSGRRLDLGSFALRSDLRGDSHTEPPALVAFKGSGDTGAPWKETPPSPVFTFKWHDSWSRRWRRRLLH